MDFLTDARLPSELHERYDGVPAARWDSVSRQAGIIAGAGQWTERLTALAGELTGDGDGADPPEWVRERITDTEDLNRFIADLDRQLKAHPERATWAGHLDYLAGLLSSYVVGAQEIVEALRGLERFTALETEVSFDQFLDVVRRAIATLRSEEVLGTRAGAFAHRGVNVLAINSLPGIEFARRLDIGCDRAGLPAACPPRPDPARRRAARRSAREQAGNWHRGPSAVGRRSWASRSPARPLASGLLCPTRVVRPARIALGCRRCSSASSPRSSTGERVSAEPRPAASPR